MPTGYGLEGFFATNLAETTEFERAVLLRRTNGLKIALLPVLPAAVLEDLSPCLTLLSATPPAQPLTSFVT